VPFLLYPGSQKSRRLLFHDNFGKSGPIFIIFTAKFRKDLWRKFELKILPPNLLHNTTLRHVMVIVKIRGVYFFETWCYHFLCRHDNTRTNGHGTWHTLKIVPDPKGQRSRLSLSSAGVELHCILDEFHSSRVHCITRAERPRAGSGVVRMDPLRFLAGCRTRRLNQG